MTAGMPPALGSGRAITTRKPSVKASMDPQIFGDRLGCCPRRGGSRTVQNVHGQYATDRSAQSKLMATHTVERVLRGPASNLLFTEARTVGTIPANILPTDSGPQNPARTAEPRHGRVVIAGRPSSAGIPADSGRGGRRFKSAQPAFVMSLDIGDRSLQMWRYPGSQLRSASWG